MSTQVVTHREPRALTLEQVLIGGDLSKLSPEQRMEYYDKLCGSIGLNPLSRPFEYLTLKGKVVLYARRDCADQLRKINGISIEIVSRSIEDGLMTVHVRAKDQHGRADEDLGVVTIGALKGEDAANAVLKCVTKAKRRVTLSISGLGFLDETEVADIPNGRAQQLPRQAALSPPPAPKPNGNGAHIVPNAGDRAMSEADERALDRNSMREMRHETPEHDPETGETGPRELSNGKQLMAAFSNAATADELSAWLQANEANLDRCEKQAPDAYNKMMQVYRNRAAELADVVDATALA